MGVSFGPVLKPVECFSEYPLHDPSLPGPAPSQAPKVFWAALIERTVVDHAVNTLLDVSMEAGGRGYVRIRWGYSRTDIARNEIIRTFKKVSENPEDFLVMLDDDHLMPPDVITRLVKWNVDVVGALAFRRGPPYFPCWFTRMEDGQTHIVLDWGEPGLIPCALVGTGAVAIKRRVFDMLDEAGYGWPYFRYTYPPGNEILPSEDIYFGNICEKCGIPHHVDTTFCIPHLSSSLVDQSTWKQYQNDHPEMMKTGKNWDKAMMGEHVVEEPVAQEPQKEEVANV
jgi:hypothetical protein